MSEIVNMDSFIRDTLRSIQRPRDENPYLNPTLISTSSKSFTTTSIPDTSIFTPAQSALLPPQAQEHQWQAIAATANTLNVKGGVFRSQGAFDQADIKDVEKLGVNSSGYVILTVIRDEDSREVTDAPTISYEEGDLAESDYYNQFIPLAKVTFEEEAITTILQLKFEELHVFEDLVVVNGEFRLAELLMAGRNIYEPPEYE